MTWAQYMTNNKRKPKSNQMQVIKSDQILSKINKTTKKRSALIQFDRMNDQIRRNLTININLQELKI